MTRSKGQLLAFNFDPDTRTAFLTYDNGRKTYLEGPIHVIVNELWNAQCAADRVDPTASFVVFSDDNPVTPLYRQAMDVFVRYR